MKLRIGFLVLAMLGGAAVAQAEVAREAWRSAFGTPRAVAVNPSDNSVWAATGSSVMHLAENGEVLSKTDGMASPEGLAVNTADGTCWVADTWHGQVVHLSAAGEQLWRGGSLQRPLSVAVNAGDGSCWVADATGGVVVHLAADGSESSRTEGFTAPRAVAVNPADGSCWVADRAVVAHLAPDGSQLWKGGAFDSAVSVSAYGDDGSCWVADADANAVVLLDSDGNELQRHAGLGRPESVSVDQADGSCWMADSGGNAVVHVSLAGGELSRTGTLRDPRSVSANPADGSCWVGEEGRGAVVHLDSNAAEVWRGGLFLHPLSVAVDPSDGSVWTADPYRPALAHLDEHGNELWSRTDPGWSPRAVAVDPTDGSVWVANIGLWDADTSSWVGSAVAHLARGGSGIWQGTNFAGPQALAVNATDRSVWVANSNGEVIHLAADGSELWRGGGLVRPTAVSVDSADGSCWVADGPGGAVVRLAEDGSEAARREGFAFPADVSANPADGSCWIADHDAGYVYHISSDGLQLSRTDAVGSPGAVAVNPADGSCWTGGDRWLVHLSPDGAALWGAPTFSEVHSLAVRPANGSCWVADSGNGQLSRIAIGLDADFSAPIRSGSPPLLVSFTDDSLGGPTTWHWDFGDGRTDTAQNPAHAYLNAGAFTVSLTISDGSGSDTETKPDYITTAIVPEAGFSASPVYGPVPLTVEFTDSSTNDPAQWSWSFGDGETSAAQHPTHTYTEAGHYTVSLTATNAGGSDTETKTEYIRATAEVSADFSLTPAVGVAPLAVTFTDLTVGATAWQWDFGDGGTSTATDPVHVYEAAGYYTVTLVAANTESSDTETKEGCVAVGFSDTAPDFWAFGPIVACATADIVQGYWDGTYRSNLEVTRGQMAVYIARGLAGGEALVPTGPATPSFTDVGVDDWDYRHVEYGADQGIVVGFWDGTYRPDEVVNRGEMSVYIARATATPTGDAGVPPATTVTFPDVTADNDWAWCYKYVEYCAAEDVVQGYWDGTYHPERTVTRDQMAVYLQRAFALPMY